MIEVSKVFGTIRGENIFISMNWSILNNVDQINAIREESAKQPVLIFKHSTSCSISRAALNRLERNWSDAATPAKLYFLDLLSYREVSNQIASAFQIPHESPQVLVVKNGNVTFDRSHFDIEYSSIAAEIQKVSKS